MSLAADNEREWARLDDALSLVSGFALLIVVVPDRESEAMVDAWLGAWAERHARVLGRLSPLDGDRRATRRLLDADAGEVALLQTTKASRSNVEALERCFVEINARRDQIAASFGGSLVISLRPDALRRLADVAPDLLSVHVAQFHLSEPLLARPAPPWLLPCFEAVGVLGVDPSFGSVSRDMMPSFIEELPPLDESVGHELEIERIEDLILAGSRKLAVVGSRDSTRSAIVRVVIEHTKTRWDRVLWFGARLIADDSMALRAVVAQLARNGEIPPVDGIDLHHRYLELTAQQRVVIVMNDTPLWFWRPSEGSLLIQTVDGHDDTVVVVDIHGSSEKWQETIVTPIGLETKAPNHHAAFMAALRLPHENRSQALDALERWLQTDAPDLDAPTIEALRAELSGAPLPPHTQGTNPRLDLLAALRSLDTAAPPSPELITQLQAATTHEWNSDDRVVLEHLAWAGLVWCHIQARDDARAQHALAEAERCARAWGSPYALLRFKLLSIELLLRSGDLHRAREPFTAARERCTELFGANHPALAVVLTRGVELLDGLAEPEEALELAEDCWQKLRYIDLPSPEIALDILRPLADFHAAHAHAKQLAAVHNRWQRELGDVPWPYPPPTQTAP